MDLLAWGVLITFLVLLGVLARRYINNSKRIFVKEILYYPIKSCAPVRVSSHTIDRLGFVYDRNWMVVNPEGRFYTQRAHPKMALIQPMITEDALIISYPNHNSVRVPLGTPESDRVIDVVVWRDTMKARVVGGEAVSSWLSDVLGGPALLVNVLGPNAHHRPLAAEYDPSRPEERIHASFADGFPFLLLSEASLSELNSQLPQPTEMDRFRGNIVIDGPGLKAYEEDCWQRILIGGLEFHVAKPCSRCTMPNVDQQTGEFHSESEPMKTLSKHRTANGKVHFGQNLVHTAAAIGRAMRVGDALTVAERGPDNRLHKRTK